LRCYLSHSVGRCGTLAGPPALLSGGHTHDRDIPATVPEDDMATLTCPACAAAVNRDDLICFTCGANLPRRGPVEEELTPPTVMQEYLRREPAASPQAPAACPGCGRPIQDRSLLICPACGKPLVAGTGPISPVVLRLAFPTGNV